MKKIGIWLDKKEAHIVSLNDKNETFSTIYSEIENYNVSGGSGTRLKGGPQDVVQDSKYLEREKHQMKRYFDDLISEIKKADVAVLFGPAEMGEKLFKEINQSHTGLKAKIKDVVKADSMTENQVKAWVKAYFKNNRL